MGAERLHRNAVFRNTTNTRSGENPCVRPKKGGLNHPSRLIPADDPDTSLCQIESFLKIVDDPVGHGHVAADWLGVEDGLGRALQDFELVEGR